MATHPKSKPSIAVFATFFSFPESLPVGLPNSQAPIAHHAEKKTEPTWSQSMPKR